MTLPYLPRLVCLSLACFCLVNFALGVSVSWLAPVVLRLAGRVRPRLAASLLLAARLLPSMAGFLVVGVVCLPSYLWLEPEAEAEKVGLVCLLAAFLSVAGWLGSVGRAVRAIVRSKQCGRRWESMGRETRLAGETVWVMDSAGGLLALAGIVRPRLMISREVLKELSAEQLETALLHERAHRTSRDNLKRFLLLLAPDAVPFGARFLGGLRKLERGWARFIEWAADDRAVEGDARRRVSLAGALVRVARIGGAEASPLMVSLVADGQDLEARVDRLLRAEPAGADRAPRMRILVAAALVLGGFVAMSPAALLLAHRMLEALIR